MNWIDKVDLWLGTFDSVGTRTIYASKIRRLPFQTLSLQNLQRWRTTTNDRLAIAAVKSFTRFLYNQGYIDTNVGRCLKIPKPTPIRTERNISKDKVLLAIGQSVGKTRLLLTLGFYLGARVSELIRIRKNDIVWTAGGCAVFLTGKGNKTRRVPLHVDVASYLQDELEGCKDYVFPGKSGPISRQTAWRWVKKAFHGIMPRASPHYLRHCMITTCIKNKCNPLTVAKIVGHSSTSVLLTYYHDTDGCIDYL